MAFYKRASLSRTQYALGFFAGVLLFVASASSALAAGKSWQPVGTPGFSSSTASYISFAFPSSSTVPYVAYVDGGNSSRVTVKKFSGGSWRTVGAQGFTSINASYVSMAFPTGSTTPYVAYSDSAYSNKVTVERFDGGAWQVVGGSGISTSSAAYISLAFPNGSTTPYVSYADNAYGGKATVMSYTGGIWKTFGQAGFSPGGAGTLSLKFQSSNTPYLAFANGAGNQATVMRYVSASSTWQTVGAANFSTGTAMYLSLAFPSASSTPYVAYQDGANSSKATVERYNNGAWQVLGSAGFSSSTADFVSVAFPTGSSTPYVAYYNYGGQYTAAVKNFSGGTWSSVGASGFTASSSNYISLAFPTGSSTPYVAYQDGANGTKLTVESFRSTTSSATTTYTLSFNTQGGSAVSSQTGLAQGATTTLPSAPTKTGYTFQHWNTASSGSGTSYNAGASYTMPGSNTTLYAIWGVNTYTLSYNINGGIGTIASSSVQYGGNFTVTATVPTKTGYTFQHWNTASSGSGTSYNSGSSFTVPASNVTLYAIWAVNTYTLSFNTQGGSAVASKTGLAQGVSTALPNAPTKTGYTFQHWNTASSGSGTSYSAGASYTMPGSNTTLYAIWAVNTYTLSYNMNGGTGSIVGASVPYGGNFSVATTVPSRSGYAFAHWNTKSDGTGTSHNSSSTFAVPANNVTLYAIWTSNTSSSNTSGGGGGGGAVSYGCHDQSATNYEPFAVNDPALCVYAATTTAVVATTTTTTHTTTQSPSAQVVEQAIQSLIIKNKDLFVRAENAGIVLPNFILQVLNLAGQGAVGKSQALSARDLTLGRQGGDVTKLQTVLISAATGPAATALAKVGTTGYFGHLTQAALAEYQLAHGINPPEGYFGSITRTYMQHNGITGL